MEPFCYRNVPLLLIHRNIPHITKKTLLLRGSREEGGYLCLHDEQGHPVKFAEYVHEYAW